jgi:hypothetical protein
MQGLINKFRSAAFDIANITYFFQTTNLNEEINCIEPSPSGSVPWCMWQFNSRLWLQKQTIVTKGVQNLPSKLFGLRNFFKIK